MNTSLFDVVTSPLKKIANLLFSLVLPVGSGNTNVGSIILVGFLFVVVIGAIMHARGRDFGGFISKIKEHRE